MTTQLLIIKIEATLSGRQNLSLMELRALASQYRKLCMEIESRIEHCVALLKAGREYPALQVAESSGLLDSVNELVFEKLDEWTAFCERENLPLPAPFDEAQIALINSIYSKSITQAHPLYRDYRRFIRLRKFEEALAVIRTISKINSLDAEARAEYDRLRSFVSKDKLKRLKKALIDEDKDKILELCNGLESEASLIAEDEVWKSALKYKGELELLESKERAKKLLIELRDIDVYSQEALSIVNELNMLRSDIDFSEADLDLLNVKSDEVLKIQAQKDELENALKAKNQLEAFLDKPKAESLSQKINIINDLLNKAGAQLDEDIKTKANLLISKFKFTRLLGNIIKVSASLSVFIIVSFLVYWVYSFQKNKAELVNAHKQLDLLRNVSSLSNLEKSLAEFKGQYASLVENNDYIKGEYASLLHYLSETSTKVKLLDGSLKELQSLDLKNASNASLENANEYMKKSAEQISILPSLLKADYEDKFATFELQISNLIDERRLQNNKTISNLNKDIQKELEQITNLKDFDENTLEINSKFEKLRPLVEERSSLFKASDVDLKKFNELLVEYEYMQDKFAKIKDLHTSLSNARNWQDYKYAITKSMNEDFVPVKIKDDFDAISKSFDDVDLGIVGQLCTKEALQALLQEKGLQPIILNLPERATNIYKYNRKNGNYVYTNGKAIEKVQEWNGGREVVQDVEEISSTSNASKLSYRYNEINGGSTRGERLLGGEITKEAQLARQVEEVAAQKSGLEALSLVVNAKVDPAFKLYLENYIYKKMIKDEIDSGLYFSQSAMQRMKKVREFALDGVSEWSWIFQSNSRKSLLFTQLYENSNWDFAREAQNTIRAIKNLYEKPLTFIGSVDENTKIKIFKESALPKWAITSDGKFKRLEKISLEGEKLMKFSPIFVEELSVEDALNNAKKIQK